MRSNDIAGAAKVRPGKTGTTAKRISHSKWKRISNTKIPRRILHAAGILICGAPDPAVNQETKTARRHQAAKPYRHPAQPVRRGEIKLPRIHLAISKNESAISNLPKPQNTNCRKARNKTARKTPGSRILSAPSTPSTTKGLQATRNTPCDFYRWILQQQGW